MLSPYELFHPFVIFGAVTRKIVLQREEIALKKIPTVGSGYRLFNRNNHCKDLLCNGILLKARTHPLWDEKLPDFTAKEIDNIKDSVTTHRRTP